MNHTLIAIGYIYLWVAAIGFPIGLPWALLNKQDMKKEYMTGWDNGWDACERFNKLGGD